MDQEGIIVRCARCGAKNRIPAYRMKENARCGKCHRPLPSRRAHEGRPVNVNDLNFKQEVIGSSEPVLVDFWASWCGHCASVAPILDQLAGEYSGRLKVAKLNVDENPQTASRYGIGSVPGMLFFKQGRVVSSIAGALPKDDLKRRIESVL